MNFFKSSLTEPSGHATIPKIRLFKVAVVKIVNIFSSFVHGQIMGTTRNSSCNCKTICERTESSYTNEETLAVPSIVLSNGES